MWGKCICCTDVKELQPLIEKSKDEEVTEKSEETKGYDSGEDSGRINITALAILAFLLLCGTGSAVMSQLAGGKTNIFQLNSLRNVISVAIALATVISRQKSLLVRREYICRMFNSGLFNFFVISGIYFASSFMPVGNTEAMYLVLYIFIPTSIDFFLGRIRLCMILSPTIAIVGLVLLAQPWNELSEDVNIHNVPCDYWERHTVSNLTNETAITSANHSDIFVNPSNISNIQEDVDNNFGINDRQNNYFIYIDGVKHHIPLNPLTLGYVITFLSAVAASVRAYLAKGLSKEVGAEALIFWLSLIEGLLAAIMTIFWCKLTGVTLYGFPSGALCLTFTLTYILLMGISHPLWVLSVGYFNVSKLVLCNLVIILLLYVCQRTLLKHFHPGEANLCETFGVVIIFCGLAIVPLSECLNIYKGSDI